MSIILTGQRPLKRVLSENGAIRSEYEEEMKKVLVIVSHMDTLSKNYVEKSHDGVHTSYSESS